MHPLTTRVWMAADTALPGLPANLLPNTAEVPSVWPLLLGVLFSAIGSGYALYGVRQRAVVPLVCGVLLTIYPWVMDSTAWLLLIGLALTLLPWFWRPQG